MDSKIVALLLKNLRVIIPDFGAFIIRQKQPRVIVFNEFLRYNDGLLIDYLVKNEGIDREIAEHQVSAVTEDWIKVLNGGKSLVIQGLGSLQKAADGKILFTEEGKPEEMQESSAFEFISDPVTENIPGIIPEVTPEVKPEVLPEVLPEVKPEVTPEVLPEVTPEVAPEVTPEVAPEVTPEIVPEPISEVIPDSEAAKPERNRTVQIFFWVILFLAINGMVIGWFVFGKGRPASQPVEPVVAKDSLFEQLADSVRAAAMDTQIVFQTLPVEEVRVAATEPIKKADKAEIIATTGTLPGFYIVLGSFKSEGNADTYLKSVEKKGFRAKILIKSEGLYSVCMGAFDSREKAGTELTLIREKFPEAWITRF